MIKDFSDTDNIFYYDGYRMGMQYANENFSNDSLQFVMGNIYQSMDGIIDSISHQAKKSNVNIDCRAGCSWCCHQAVFALDYEIKNLALYIKSNLTQSILATIKQRAVEKFKKTKLLKSTDLLNYKSACPLLDSNKCIAYAARPMACRIYLSKNEDSCKEFFHNPENEQTYPQLLEFPLRAGRIMNEGFKAALKTNGKIAKEFTIESGLFSILD